MIKVLEDIEVPGEEVKCEHCGAVVHCEEHDWHRVHYFYHNELRKNYAIDCPKCYCTICRYEDR